MYLYVQVYICNKISQKPTPFGASIVLISFCVFVFMKFLRFRMRELQQNAI